MKALLHKIQPKQPLQKPLILGIITLFYIMAVLGLFKPELAQPVQSQKIQVEIIEDKQNNTGVVNCNLSEWSVCNLWGQHLWEWIKLLLPLLVGTVLVSFFQWLKAKEDKKITDERHQQEVLINYFNQITQLIIKQDAPEIKPNEITLTVVRARTLTVLQELDGKRKGLLIRFLAELRIIELIDLSEVDLSQADLQETYLKKAVLYKVNLNRANLRQANLEEANLERANLERANLEGANLCQVNLEEANLKETCLKKSSLKHSNLTRVHLKKANLELADLEAANLTGSHLEQTDFYQAHLQRANLEGANLEGANFEEANLAEANFFGANLEEADFSKANIEKVKNVTESQRRSAKNWIELQSN